MKRVDSGQWSVVSVQRKANRSPAPLLLRPSAPLLPRSSAPCPPAPLLPCPSAPLPAVLLPNPQSLIPIPQFLFRQESQHEAVKSLGLLPHDRVPGAWDNDIFSLRDLGGDQVRIAARL